jgi:nickel/cobalt transporter (NicO) family protein
LGWDSRLNLAASARRVEWGRLRAGTAAAVPLLMTLLLLLGASAGAHPLGNFTINHYTAIDAQQDGVAVAYVLDMAEIPTFQELGHLDDVGLVRHLMARLGAWNGGLHLAVNGVPTLLNLRAARVMCLPGAGGLPLLRVEEDLWAGFSRAAPLDSAKGHPVTVTYRDANFPERVGWKEIIVTGRNLRSSSASRADRGSNRLHSYPVDLLRSPPDETVAHFTLWRNGPSDVRAPLSAGTPSVSFSLSGCHVSARGVGAPGSRAGGPRYAAESTAFGALFKPLTGGHPDFRVLAIALAGAFVLGAYHALTPGHGKAILAAYFIGERGTPMQAALLGGVVTLTHTSGVFLLGFVTLVASHYIVPERLYPWLSMLSGIMLVGIGGSLFLCRLNVLRTGRGHRRGHDHGHSHPHEPGHDHGYIHVPGLGHDHRLPASGPLRAGDLITLGVTGGILPCPSAVVVMLAAISVGQIALGLLMITAFSLGLAGVLTTGGLLMVYGRAFMTRLLEHPAADPPRPGWRSLARLLQRLPVCSAAALALLGLLIIVQAVSATWTSR